MFITSHKKYNISSAAVDVELFTLLFSITVYMFTTASSVKDDTPKLCYFIRKSLGYPLFWQGILVSDPIDIASHRVTALSYTSSYKLHSDSYRWNPSPPLQQMIQSEMDLTSHFYLHALESTYLFIFPISDNFQLLFSIYDFKESFINAQNNSEPCPTMQQKV